MAKIHSDRPLFAKQRGEGVSLPNQAEIFSISIFFLTAKDAKVCAKDAKQRAVGVSPPIMNTGQCVSQ